MVSKRLRYSEVWATRFGRQMAATRPDRVMGVPLYGAVSPDRMNWHRRPMVQPECLSTTAALDLWQCLASYALQPRDSGIGTSV